MIKVALKHWIYEKCINVLFNNIICNFYIPIKNILHTGDKFHIIISKTGSPYGLWRFSDVKVVGYTNNNLITGHVIKCNIVSLRKISRFIEKNENIPSHIECWQGDEYAATATEENVLHICREPDIIYYERA